MPEGTNSLRALLKGVIEGRRTLAVAEARDAAGAMLDGEASDAEIAALLTAMAVRGETVEELLGFVEALRERMRLLPLQPAERAALVDTCGTGGDGCGTFNISTAAALVAAAAGARVAKHGNRAVTSKCGSADVLEALGVPVGLSEESAAACLRTHGFVFLLAPAAHPAMRHVQPVRRALGFRGLFHMAGPLSNPAGARAQVMGVFARDRVGLVAAAMARLGVRHGMVVHGSDGLDELTLTGATTVAEVREGRVQQYEFVPEQVGLTRAPLKSLLGGETAQENAALLEAVISGRDTSEWAGARRDVVALNAAAALVVAGVAPDLREGVARARGVIEHGQAAALLAALRRFGQEQVAAVETGAAKGSVR